MRTFNVRQDYENGLCIFKSMMQDYSEEALSATFNGGARIARATSPIPRGLPYAVDLDGTGDYLSYGNVQLTDIKTEDFSVEFWVNTTDTAGVICGKRNGEGNGWIVKTAAGPDINFEIDDGTEASGNNTTALSAGWHHVIIAADRSGNATFYIDGAADGTLDISGSAGTLTNSTSFMVGIDGDGASNPLDGEIAGLRIWNCLLSATEALLLYNGTVSQYRNEYSLLLDLPSLVDKSGNVAVSTNNGADIVASGRNAGNALDFVSANTDDVTVPALGNIGTLALWINPDNVTQSILDCDGGSHKITVSAGTITATGFTAYYVDSIVSGTLSPKTWQFLVATDSTAFSASALTLGKEGANYLDGMIDAVAAFSSELESVQIRELYYQTCRGLL